MGGDTKWYEMCQWCDVTTDAQVCPDCPYVEQPCRWTRDKFLVLIACDGSRHPGLTPDTCPACGKLVEVV